MSWKILETTRNTRHDSCLNVFSLFVMLGRYPINSVSEKYSRGVLLIEEVITHDRWCLAGRIKPDTMRVARKLIASSKRLQTRHNKKARSHSRRVMDTNLCTSPIYCGSEPAREAFRAEPRGSVLVHLSHQFRLGLGQAAGLGQFIDAGAHADQACRLGERQA